MTDFNKLPDVAIEELTQLSRELKGVILSKTCSWDLHTGGLDLNGEEPDLIRKVREWASASGVYLYVITRESSDPPNEAVSRAFAEAKATSLRAYARLNEPSSCVYVGSSEKVHQRLKEHLGFGAMGTYSLQLAEWSAPFNLHLRFSCAQYSAATPSRALQALEDALWSHMKPMFGRRGAR